MLLNREAELVIAALKAGYQEDNTNALESALRVYKELCARNGAASVNAVSMKDALLDMYNNALASDAIANDEGFIALTETWARERLQYCKFKDLEGIRELESSI